MGVGWPFTPCPIPLCIYWHEMKEGFMLALSGQRIVAIQNLKLCVVLIRYKKICCAMVRYFFNF
jgi:hypothetical protein